MCHYNYWILKKYQYYLTNIKRAITIQLCHCIHLEQHQAHVCRSSDQITLVFFLSPLPLYCSSSIEGALRARYGLPPSCELAPRRAAAPLWLHCVAPDPARRGGEDDGGSRSLVSRGLLFRWIHLGRLIFLPAPAGTEMLTGHVHGAPVKPLAV